MPGMETRAPLRTEMRSGLDGSPNFLPVFFSTTFMLSRTCSHMPSGNLLPRSV